MSKKSGYPRTALAIAPTISNSGAFEVTSGRHLWVDYLDAIGLDETITGLTTSRARSCLEIVACLRQRPDFIQTIPTSTRVRVCALTKTEGEGTIRGVIMN
jgi:hypothetical protein